MWYTCTPKDEEIIKKEGNYYKIIHYSFKNPNPTPQKNWKRTEFLKFHKNFDVIKQKKENLICRLFRRNCFIINEKMNWILPICTTFLSQLWGNPKKTYIWNLGQFFSSDFLSHCSRKLKFTRRKYIYIDLTQTFRLFSPWKKNIILDPISKSDPQIAKRHQLIHTRFVRTLGLKNAHIAIYK